MATRTIHPFPARMAPEIALQAIPAAADASRQMTVVDPMCGSGTVLAAAVSRGHRAVGVDIDPLAVMMSRVATTAVDPDLLRQTAGKVCTTAALRCGAPPWTDDDTDAFVDFWFGPSQRKQLIALSSAVSTVQHRTVREALQVALSRIIVTKSPQASLASDTSHSRPHRTLESSDYDVLAGFTRSVKALARLLPSAMAGSAEVFRGDSRALPQISPESADLMVTSPPYLNALDYLRGHKLALVWFGFSISELRRLRAESIGSERAASSSASPLAEDLVKAVVDDAANPASLRLGMVRRFANDMASFAASTHRVLKPGAGLVLVVGNSTLRGNYIRTDEIARNALQHFGFELRDRVEREIPSSSRYLAINTSQNSSLQHRMRSEIILTMARTS